MSALMTVGETARRRGHRVSYIYFELARDRRTACCDACTPMRSAYKLRTSEGIGISHRHLG